MPEIAALGAVGFVVCWILNLWTLYLMKRDYESREYQNVQANLGRIEKYWSDRQSQILPLNGQSLTESMKQDQRESFRSFLHIAVLAGFASWAGVIFMALFLISLRVLARPRLEIQIMNSELARESELQPGHIEQIIKSMS